MKKLYILLLILGFAWVGKLSYEVFQLSEQQTNLIQASHQLEKTNSKLNDQLIALQRTELSSTVNNPQPISPLSNGEFHDLSQDLIKQQLLLVEFSLKQQQPYYAVEKLIELTRVIDDYPISVELKASLEHAMSQDIELIKQYIVRRDAQDKKIEKILQKLDRDLKSESLDQHLLPAAPKNEYFWQKWFSVNQAVQPATQLIERPLIMKEAQLRLLMARQLLLDGQYAQYQLELSEITALLKQLPDQKTKQILAQIEALKSDVVISQPILNTRELIG